MTFEFELPDPGEGLTEAEIVEWFVEEGDEVEEDDALGEVETDKAVTEIPSPVSGTIQELAADEGATVEVGEVIVVFDTGEEEDEEEAEEKAEEKADEAEDEAEETDEDEGDEESEEEDTEEESEESEEEAEDEEESEEDEAEQVVTEVEDEEEDEEGEEAEETESSETETEEPKTEEGRVFAAPSTRRYAREEGIDLSDVDGSGPDGRILREDIDEHAGGEEESEVGALHPSVDIEPTAVDEDESRSERRDLSGLRAQIAENMVRSKTVTAHLTSGFEADAEELVSLKERLDEKHDVHITYTPILLKAVVPALKEFPLVNASIDDSTGEIVEKHYYNIGFATHTDEGLMVPVVKDIDQKSIVEVAEEILELSDQARDREIDLSDMQGGTFTVTNLALDGEHRTSGTPVINHPEAAIMGIGPIKEKPVAVEGEVEVRQRIPLSLSFDHRLIDGVTANRFMEHVIEGIEDTDILLSRL